MADHQVLENARQKILEQNAEKAVAFANQAIAEGVDPLVLMNEGFIPGINEVGDRFGRGKVFLPELMQAADAMKAVTDVVNDALSRSGQSAGQTGGRVLVATVKGDVHDIGKCIVVSLLKANGFEVFDLGRDVDTQAIVEEAVKQDVGVIGTSALLTTTMNRQKELEEALKEAGLREKIKTVVGGAPVTARWAKRIGADAYAEDAQDGVVRIKELLAGTS